MPTLTIDDVQSRLPEIIAALPPGEELIITRDGRAIATLVTQNPAKPTPVFGSCRGMLTILAEDDDHLKDFAEYMP